MPLLWAELNLNDGHTAAFSLVSGTQTGALGEEQGWGTLDAETLNKVGVGAGSVCYLAYVCFSKMAEESQEDASVSPPTHALKLM